MANPGQPRAVNRLIAETSPYLLQHAHNPVDWYPWGPEALERARAEDKPILLSVGYSACHWCHVMAHESFEDSETAALMNKWFINIKVDREERPDIDAIYMQAVQTMTGRGGWPMTVFLTPDGRPFYGGTYFPSTSRYGMPSFRQVLQAIADAWQERRRELELAGDRLGEALNRNAAILPAITPLGPDALDRAVRGILRSHDPGEGGFGQAPKFPQPMILEFLLQSHRLGGDSEALQAVSLTLTKMARGGIYDQLGGGFHRYSTDNRWLVPHFEKMVYDQSQLARVYLHAWQVTDNRFFRTITEEILDYVVREMSDPAGGFYSTQDADSEGVEGKFFVWTLDEIRQVLGNDAQSDAFMAAYGVTPGANFEGKNILEFVGELDERAALAEARGRLLESRERRVHTGRDEKVLASWNGLMLAAFAEAARTLDRADYRRVAERNADFLLNELRQENGRLLRTWKAGEARLNGYLEDYACLIQGLLELYQSTFEPRWFVAAQELAETMIARFQASDGLQPQPETQLPGNAGGIAGFYDTSDDHETLVTRPRALQDNATPSGNAMAVTVLLKLAGFTNDLRYVEIAHRALAQMQSMMAQYPLGFGQWLQALAYALSQPREIAILGRHDSADTQALLSVVRDGYRPFQVVALGSPDMQPRAVPLLRERGLVGGRAAAYVCRDFACQAPVTTPQALGELLDIR
jgi:uncharacterized protein YyaL (SSP411 family)